MPAAFQFISIHATDLGAMVTCRRNRVAVYASVVLEPRGRGQAAGPDAYVVFRRDDVEGSGGLSWFVARVYT